MASTRSLGLVADTRDELAHLRHDAVGVLCKQKVVGARQLYVTRAGDVLGQVAAVLGTAERVTGAVQDQGRHADRRQDRARVGVVRTAQQRDGSARAGGKALVARPPRALRRVVRLTGHQRLEGDALAPARLDRL